MVLLCAATIAVIASIPTQSALVLSGSSVASLVLAWAALRMMWTEVLVSRREHALDRAQAAGAYRSLFTERAAEHAEFTSSMTERLAESNVVVGQLQETLIDTEKRAIGAELRAQREGRRLVELQDQVNELEHTLAVRQAEQADALASWEAEGGDPISDLVNWDERATQKAADDLADKVSAASTRKGA
ncbi:MAG: putative multidomain rane protein [Marmoricola sp.]|nr:putative multidomain rane protein [Marmoricola sp.]